MDCCHETIIHQEIVEKFENLEWDKIGIKHVAQMLKLLSDETRLKILYLLLFEKMCVCDIAYVLKMSHSAISHQLRGLRQEGIIESEKAGKVVYYSINSDHTYIGILKQLFYKNI
ncbi:MAG: metalloregulator ArsR/SmtB family transcription factor [Fusobacteria bacterium]|nr:metalloregulator ArsR/SmtB family transcription factor [Fusobacteriota bacterium]